VADVLQRKHQITREAGIDPRVKLGFDHRHGLPQMDSN
jgi:hypothetical protein